MYLPGPVTNVTCIHICRVFIVNERTAHLGMLCRSFKDKLSNITGGWAFQQ